MNYWTWVETEAMAIGSDGCTVVSELFHPCCSEHDLAYGWNKDPRDAYKLDRAGNRDPWGSALPITRAEADRRFRECIQSRSRFGRWSPIAWIRWVGVRVGGYWSWET